MNQANTQSDSNLVTLTESAVAKVRAMMEKEGKKGYGLRFGVKAGGCSGLF